MASRVYDILNNIERGRKACIKNAKLANLPALNNMNFDDIAALFLQQNNPDNIYDYVRPEDWWDTETILANAENKVDSEDVTVYPAYILLLANWDNTTTFDATATNASLRGDGYLTSDGTWYGTPTATHTWDTTQDKPCSLGYKTRYVIVYVKDKTNLGGDLNFRNFRCLELRTADITIGGLYFGNSNSPQNKDIENVILGDHTTIYSLYTGCFQNCYGLKNIYAGNLEHMSGRYGYHFNNCYNLISANFPNLTTLLDDSTRIFAQCRNFQKLLMPKATNLRSDSYMTGGAKIVDLRSLETTGLSIGSGARDIRLDNLTTISVPLGNGPSHIILPKLTTITSGGFKQMYNLHAITAPMLTNITSNEAFSDCNGLTTLVLPALKSLIGGPNTFNACTALESVSFPNLETITNGNTFNGATSLKSLTIPATIQSLPTNTTPAFGAYLVYLNLPNGFNISGLNLTGDVSLCHESLVDILNKLADVTEEQDTYTLTLGTTNLAKLTAEEIAIGTAKGWTIS